MVVYTVQGYLRHKIPRLKRNLTKLQRTLPQSAGRYMVRQAKMMAPEQTGRLKQSISTWPRKKGEATVAAGYSHNGFPVAKFVNLSPGYSALNYSIKYNKYFATPQVVTYGAPAISRGRNPVRWTGTPRFWDIARRKTANYFRKKAIDGLKMVLR